MEDLASAWDALPDSVLSLKGSDADGRIGTCPKAVERNTNVVIVSGDKDSRRLVSLVSG